MINFKTSAPSSMLGLKLEGQRLQAVVIHRAQDALQLEKATDLTLTMDLLKDNPEQVGAEIREQLNNAGIKESRCIVCVPLNWMLTMQTEMPDLSPEDLPDFLNIQAEREFPFAPEDLCMSLSEYRDAKDNSFATLGAIPRKKIEALMNVLSAAGLKLSSISIGIPAVRKFDASSTSGSIDLLLGENGIDLQITSGGGIVALRSLADIEKSEQGWDSLSLAKQIRITMGQLSEEVRTSIKHIHVFGAPDEVRAAVDSLNPHQDRLGLSIEKGILPNPKVAGILNEVQSVCPSLALLVAQQLESASPAFEFLPPKISKFKELSDRFSSGRNMWLGTAAAVIFLITFVSFQIQGWKLSKLESEWVKMEPVVDDVEEIQGRIRQFRPWFDASPRSLIIAKQITEAFPERGDVWVKSLEINSEIVTATEIQCAGFADSSEALAEMIEKLNEMETVNNLQVPSQIQSNDGIDFQLTFIWNGGGAQ